jgi:hypothetical protein
MVFALYRQAEDQRDVQMIAENINGSVTRESSVTNAVLR